MTVLSGLDAAGRRRSPATLPGYHAGRSPRNKGMRYPADPPTVDEIVAVMRHTSDNRHGWRLRAIIVVLWRAGLRIQEALALAEHDLDHRRGSILVRSGKGGRRREVGMDEWGWEQLRPWLTARLELPVGPLFRRPGRRQAPLRATPTAPCARAGTRPRGRAAEHHPAPARSRQPRHDLDLPPRHRSRGDHRHRPHAPGANDVRQRRPAARSRRSRRLVLVRCGCARLNIETLASTASDSGQDSARGRPARARAAHADDSQRQVGARALLARRREEGATPQGSRSHTPAPPAESCSSDAYATLPPGAPPPVISGRTGGPTRGEHD